MTRKTKPKKTQYNFHKTADSVLHYISLAFLLGAVGWGLSVVFGL